MRRHSIHFKSANGNLCLYPYRGVQSAKVIRRRGHPLLPREEEAIFPKFLKLHISSSCSFKRHFCEFMQLKLINFVI